MRFPLARYEKLELHRIVPYFIVSPPSGLLFNIFVSSRYVLFSYDVEPYNVTVHVIEPGLFKTPMVNTELERQRIRDEFRNTSDEIQKCYGEEYLNKCASPWYEVVRNNI